MKMYRLYHPVLGGKVPTLVFYEKLKDGCVTYTLFPWNPNTGEIEKETKRWFDVVKRIKDLEFGEQTRVEWIEL